MIFRFAKQLKKKRNTTQHNDLVLINSERAIKL